MRRSRSAFAMAVTWPEAGNIGGGGFMMVAAPGKEPTCFEYRETAPAAAKVDLFADGKVTWLDHKAAGVPGTVRGLALAHAKYGKLAVEGCRAAGGGTRGKRLHRERGAG